MYPSWWCSSMTTCLAFVSFNLAGGCKGLSFRHVTCVNLWMYSHNNTIPFSPPTETKQLSSLVVCTPLSVHLSYLHTSDSIARDRRVIYTRIGNPIAIPWWEIWNSACTHHLLVSYRNNNLQLLFNGIVWQDMPFQCSRSCSPTLVWAPYWIVFTGLSLKCNTGRCNYINLCTINGKRCFFKGNKEYAID